MDAHGFDALTRSLLPASRRGTLRLLLGAVLGGLLPLGPLPTAATKHRGKVRKKGDTNQKQKGDTGSHRKRRTATTEHCLAIGEKCPKTVKHGKKTRRHRCTRRCCTRYAVVSSDGTRRCACRPNGATCTPETARQCCSQLCTGGVCGPSGQRVPACAETCAGCCDGRGTCQAGTVDAACGTGGAACVTCSGSGVTCGGDGTAGVCGCTPRCGAGVCGSNAPDGCGGTMNCGGCSSGGLQVCVENQCESCGRHGQPCCADDVCIDLPCVVGRCV